MTKDRRFPEKTPGPAITQQLPNDDFTLPAALYWDAHWFLERARELADHPRPGASERYLRAAVSAVFASFEAQINASAFGHATAHANVLMPMEKDVLEERETVLENNGLIVRRTKHYAFEARVAFLTLFLSGKELDRSTALWQRFVQAKVLRDRWTHPKPPFDTWSLTIEAVEEVITAVKDMVLEMSKLAGVEPPLWMEPEKWPPQKSQVPGK